MSYDDRKCGSPCPVCSKPNCLCDEPWPEPTPDPDCELCGGTGAACGPDCKYGGGPGTCPCIGEEPEPKNEQRTTAASIAAAPSTRWWDKPVAGIPPVPADWPALSARVIKGDATVVDGVVTPHNPEDGEAFSVACRAVVILGVLHLPKPKE